MSNESAIGVAMNLKSLTNAQLNDLLQNLAKSERKLTHEILLHINEVESRRLFAQYGFGSTLDYLVKECHYSESSAYRRIQAARLLKIVPEVSTKIEEGKINLTQLSKVQSLIQQQEKQTREKVTLETKQDLLQKIENQNSFHTEKLIAKELNIIIQDRDVVKVQQDESVYVSLKLSKEQNEKIKEVKSLMSHINPNPTFAEVFEYLADFYVAKKKGLKKIQTQTQTQTAIEVQSNTEVRSSHLQGRSLGGNSVQSNQKKTIKNKIQRNPITGHVIIKGENAKQHRSAVFQRAHIPSSIKNAVKYFANHQREFIDDKTGRRCLSKHQLEIDHKIPKTKGGGDCMTNLRVLCKQHNLQSFQNWF